MKKHFNVYDIIYSSHKYDSFNFNSTSTRCDYLLELDFLRIHGFTLKDNIVTLNKISRELIDELFKNEFKDLKSKWLKEKTIEYRFNDFFDNEKFFFHYKDGSVIIKKEMLINILVQQIFKESNIFPIFQNISFSRELIFNSFINDNTSDFLKFFLKKQGGLSIFNGAKMSENRILWLLQTNGFYRSNFICYLTLLNEFEKEIDDYDATYYNNTASFSFTVNTLPNSVLKKKDTLLKLYQSFVNTNVKFDMPCFANSQLIFSLSFNYDNGLVFFEVQIIDDFIQVSNNKTIWVSLSGDKYYYTIHSVNNLSILLTHKKGYNKPIRYYFKNQKNNILYSKIKSLGHCHLSYYFRFYKSIFKCNNIDYLVSDDDNTITMLNHNIAINSFKAYKNKRDLFTNLFGLTISKSYSKLPISFLMIFYQCAEHLAPSQFDLFLSFLNKNKDYLTQDKNLPLMIKDLFILYFKKNTSINKDLIVEYLRVCEVSGNLVDIKISTTNKMNQVHVKLATEINLKKMGELVVNPIFNIFNNPDFRLINTSADLLKEGIEMKNCVASHFKSINKGNYAIFSVSLNNKRLTVSIFNNSKNKKKHSFELSEASYSANREVSQEVWNQLQEFIDVSIKKWEMEQNQINTKQKSLLAS